jgi:V/A-type H+-transporting ATPase subunit K
VEILHQIVGFLTGNLIFAAEATTKVAQSVQQFALSGFNWQQFLAYLGLGFLGLGLSGSAIGLAIGGSAVAGMREEKRTQGLLVSVLPGTQGLYSFAVGFLCLTSMNNPDKYLYIFASGVVTGIACLISGWWQGVVCAAGIKAINQDKLNPGIAIMLAVFPEFYAILSFAMSALFLFVF